MTGGDDMESPAHRRGSSHEGLASFAGVALDRPRIMGIVNVTPDSFSDGGDFAEAEAAIRHGERLLAEGADILDVGGESTRPGAEPVPEQEELRRVLPVVRALAGLGAPVSIDTRRAGVAAAAFDAGARIVNDVTALSSDPRAVAVAAAKGASVVLMHMQGEPQTMQQAPHYDDVVVEVRDYLAARIAVCEAAGIPRHRIAIDPGIGFGKTIGHNLSLLQNLDVLAPLGCPVLLGVSRKGFIARLSRSEAPKDRVFGSLAAAFAGILRGARILRVHDVDATRQALAVWQAIAEA